MIGHDVASVVPMLRDEARSLMIDVATVTRQGALTMNPTTGVLEPGPATTVYTGSCRLRQPSVEESEVLFGDEQVTRTRLVLSLPFDTDDLAIDDVATIAGSFDADVGVRSFRVMAVPLSTFTLHKSYPVEVVE